MSILVTTIDTPVGPINIATTDAGLAAAETLTPPDVFIAALEGRRRISVERLATGSTPQPRTAHLERAVAAFERYFAGEPETFDLPLDLAGSGSRRWDLTVLGGVRTIPWGEVSSYGRVARRIGKPGAARAVGGAVGRNPIGIVIPCHRVIAGDGSIGGYGGDWWGSREQLISLKRQLLELEGVTLPVGRFAD
jgi:methylated-DNA-[protein]-cysteine S-methyltransferase